jgi:flagellin
MLHFAADPEAGTITVYDQRTFDLRTMAYQYPNLQEKGAKLADGVLDDVQKATRGVFVRDLVIHHTDKANMNIHVRIPQTSMDHLFNYIPGVADWTDYDVLTKANREKLLGNQGGRPSADGSRMVQSDERGLLDRAIEYLTDANTLVGAQTSRLEMTHDNIIIQQETNTSSESTVRDADMAKEMTDYTRSNVLTQAAQSMLAQANQNSSSVLSLLQ